MCGVLCCAVLCCAVLCCVVCVGGVEGERRGGKGGEGERERGGFEVWGKEGREVKCGSLKSRECVGDPTAHHVTSGSNMENQSNTQL